MLNLPHLSLNLGAKLNKYVVIITTRPIPRQRVPLKGLKFANCATEHLVYICKYFWGKTMYTNLSCFVTMKLIAVASPGRHCYIYCSLYFCQYGFTMNILQVCPCYTYCNLYFCHISIQYENSSIFFMLYLL